MAVRIDASGDFLGRTASLPDPTAVTMSGWAYMVTDRAASSSVCELCISAARTNGQLCLQTQTDGNTFNIWYDSGSITTQEPSTGYAAAVGVPFFFALTSSGTGGSSIVAYFREYGSRDFNTVFTATTGLGATYTPTSMRFGNATTSEFWNGRVWNVKVWNRALTRDELLVESYYRRPKFPSNLHIWAPLHAATDVNDYSGNGFNFTAGGTLSTEQDATALWQPSKKIFIPAGATGISGEAAITLGDVTLSSASTLALAGTLSKTLDDVTLSSAATLALSGSAAITLGDVTLSSDSDLAIVGSLSKTLDDVTLVSEGTIAQDRTGEAAITLEDVSLNSAGTLAIAGAAAITLDNVTLSAAGNGPIVDTEDTIDGQVSYSIQAAYGSVTIYHRGDRRFFTLASMG